jgi:UDP-arabinose 4-epimerase
MNNILVTGGAGYIGSHTSKQLAREGYSAVVFDNIGKGHRWAARWAPLVEGELEDTELLRHTIRSNGIEAVIHFAASACVGESMRDPQRYFRNNVAGTISLLEAIRDTGLRYMVFSSTCATYGCPSAIPITESETQAPVNPYGESKLFVERMLHWHTHAYGLRYVSLRYFNAAGADLDGELGEDHDPETHLIPLTIQTALRQREYLEVFGTDYPTRDGTAIRDYIHVCDLAHAHVSALRYLERGGASDAFNLGTGRGISIREIIECVEEVSQRSVAVREAPRRSGDPKELVADPSKAERLLGWRPRHSDLRNIVETAWNWHRRPRSSSCKTSGGFARVAEQRS